MTHTEDIAAAISAGEPVLILSAPAESPTTITRYMYEGPPVAGAIRAHLHTCRAGGGWARAILAAGVCVETGESVALSAVSRALLQRCPSEALQTLTPKSLDTVPQCATLHTSQQ